MTELVLYLTEDELLRDPLRSQSKRHNDFNPQASQQNRHLSKTIQDNLSKKYRDEANIKFNSEGNRIQFRLTRISLRVLTKSTRNLYLLLRLFLLLLVNCWVSLEKEINSSGLLIIPPGWATVKEYESNDTADNYENEKKIRQAETMALKTIKEKQTRPQPYTARSTPEVEHIATAPAPPPAYDFSRYQQPFRASTAPRDPCSMDICHYCKQYGEETAPSTSSQPQLLHPVTRQPNSNDPVTFNNKYLYLCILAIYVHYSNNDEFISQVYFLENQIFYAHEKQ
ncbi:unnamed protein product [Mytilus coruscus]|uniref:Uncharacterized protein n=1 Tax=Mytilus coruscus TaxID=42192 RepID=A0A6J8CN59_MYTCO|nr:unnamed protein product [Mytilus coruscus]